MILTDVPNQPQTTAGGSDPQFDCFEEAWASLSRYYADRPGVQVVTVQEAEVIEAQQGGNPVVGTVPAVGSRAMTSGGLPNHPATQPLEDAANRGHHSIALVKSDGRGIPSPVGNHLHWCVYLGAGWYRNPATGARTNTPALAPAYTGECIEIDLPAVLEDVMNEAQQMKYSRATVLGWYWATGTHETPDQVDLDFWAAKLAATDDMAAYEPIWQAFITARGAQVPAGDAALVARIATLETDLAAIKAGIK